MFIPAITISLIFAACSGIFKNRGFKNNNNKMSEYYYYYYYYYGAVIVTKSL